MKKQWYDNEGNIFEIEKVDNLKQITYINVFKSIFLKAKIKQDKNNT